MPRLTLFVAGLILSVAPVLTAGAAPAAPPNILVVLTDDLGFSDLGCYGSEIPTPNLDRLAANGVRFTQFSNTAKCHSSRVSLLSGLYCKQAGDIELTRAVIIPEMLGPAGYFTAMTGKWHLSREPTDFGFDRYFGHLSGATDYYRGNASFRLNGQRWQVPDAGFYTTVANVDSAIDFLAEARATRKPWFLYVAFNAPHGPLQPLEADYRKYRGRYDVGWDVVRAARAAKQRDLGLFGRDVEPSPRPDHVPAWEALPPETQAWESRRMAAYAALIDRVDQELGRLFADLERAGEFENTFVLFLSDNGACPYDRRTVGRDREPYEPGVAWSDSTGWAWARNTPFRYYKQNQFEGGIATPAIVHWPAGIPPLDRAANDSAGEHQGRLVHAPAHLIDVLPTLAEIAGTQRPDTWPGREPDPLPGVSLVPLLTGGEMDRRPPIHLLFSEDRGLRDGDWKLVSFRSEPWELYNIAADRTELHDVAAEHPEIVARMAQQWTDIARDVLRCTARESRDLAATATAPQPTTPRSNVQWTDYSAPDASAARHAARRGPGMRPQAAGRSSEADPRSAPLPRARAGTKLTVEDGGLVLACSGDDPGLAFDRLDPQPKGGPYTLAFRLQSQASGAGKLFWTTAAGVSLPRGERLDFPVTHDGSWHDLRLVIPEDKPLHGLRLDPCGGPGTVRLEGLVLEDAAGTVIRRWP